MIGIRLRPSPFADSPLQYDKQTEAYESVVTWNVTGKAYQNVRRRVRFASFSVVYDLVESILPYVIQEEDDEY